MTDYSDFLIADFDYWQVFLHPHQSYLGRVYLWVKRDNVVDMFDITQEELVELQEIASALKKTLLELFQPDLFNWASFGNETAHCHVHLIPRYKEDRVYSGEIFRDENWGKNYAPYNNLLLNSEQLNRIKNVITVTLEKHRK